MGLLKGVIIDAHFLQRGRHEPFLELMKEHPQMLGIGIDENTAVIINKHSARVIGPNAVSFYDLKGKGGEDFKPVILKSGETYDLKSKTAVK
jgi:cyanophycinase-like exopeptidase